jgi:hypothetical protein
MFIPHVKTRKSWAIVAGTVYQNQRDGYFGKETIARCNQKSTTQNRLEFLDFPQNVTAAGLETYVRPRSGRVSKWSHLCPTKNVKKVTGPLSIPESSLRSHPPIKALISQTLERKFRATSSSEYGRPRLDSPSAVFTLSTVPIVRGRNFSNLFQKYFNVDTNPLGIRPKDFLATKRINDQNPDFPAWASVNALRIQSLLWFAFSLWPLFDCLFLRREELLRRFKGIERARSESHGKVAG